MTGTAMLPRATLFATTLIVAAVSFAAGAAATPMMESGSPMPGASAAAARAYDAGTADLAKGDLAAAEAEFSRANRLSPGRPEPLLGLAEVARRSGEPAAAETALDRAVAAAPQLAAVRIAFGKFLLERHRLPEAEAAFKMAVQLDPTALRPHIDLGDLYLLVLRQPAKAVRAYQAAAKLAPDDPAVAMPLATALMQAGRLAVARSVLENAAEVAPNDPRPLIAEGNLLLQAGDTQAAAAMFDRVIARWPALPRPHLGKGTALLHQGNATAALAEFETVLRGEPANRDALVLAALCDQELSDHDAARHILRTASIADPGLLDMVNDLAWIGADHAEHLNQALALAKLLIELAPNSAAYRDTLGWVYRARGELPQAAGQLEAAARLHASPEILTHLARVYRAQGHAAEADAALAKALALDPHYQPEVQARHAD